MIVTKRSVFLTNHFLPAFYIKFWLNFVVPKFSYGTLYGNVSGVRNCADLLAKENRDLAFVQIIRVIFPLEPLIDLLDASLSVLTGNEAFP